jgi:hypothetical protein
VFITGVFYIKGLAAACRAFHFFHFFSPNAERLIDFLCVVIIFDL